MNFIFVFLIKVCNIIGLNDYNSLVAFIQYLHKPMVGLAVGFLYDWTFEDYYEEIGEDDAFTLNALMCQEIFYYHFTHRARRRFLKYLR
jgi:hypothetical protein